MASHVFVVDGTSYSVHRDRLFCGVKRPTTETKKGNLNSAHYNLIADISMIRKGDTVFFYQMQEKGSSEERGFRGGIFRVSGKPYFDKTRVEGLNVENSIFDSTGKAVDGSCPGCSTSGSETRGDENLECKECGRTLEHHILPFRVPIEVDQLYVDADGNEAVINDNTAYIDRNYIRDNLPVLWTLLFRKVYGAGRNRSIAPILPEESDKLRHIFDDLFSKIDAPNFPRYEPAAPEPIFRNYSTLDSGELNLEAMLQLWISHNIDRLPDDDLNKIVGDPAELEFKGNCVLYGIGGENVDLLLIHNDGSGRTRATVIELKKGSLVKHDIDQVRSYIKWISQLVFGDDRDESIRKIQPVLIGHRVGRGLDKLVGDANNELQCMPLNVLTYHVSNDHSSITFDRAL